MPQTATVSPRYFTDKELALIAKALSEAADQYDQLAARFARSSPHISDEFAYLAVQTRAMQLEIEAR